MTKTLLHLYLIVLVLLCIAIGMFIAHKLGVEPCINRIHQLEATLKIYNIPSPPRN